MSSKHNKRKKRSIESICTSEGDLKINTKPHIHPIFATSSFSFQQLEEATEIFKGNTTGDVYSRYGNPGFRAFEEKIAALEGINLPDRPECLVTSSGMSAIHCTLSTFLTSEDLLIAQGNLYGGTTEYIQEIKEKIGFKLLKADLNKPDEIGTVHSNGETYIFGETPSNPDLQCIDLQGLASWADMNNATTIIDNTFATPILQRPLEFGIDYVIHSTTKYLNGHGNALGGAIVTCHKQLLHEKIWKTLKLNGLQANPFDVFLCTQGIKTLALRMNRACANATRIATFLNKHEAVNRVNYPGLKSHKSHNIAQKQMNDYGAMMSFECIGGYDAAKRFTSELEMISITPTLGNLDSLVLHPASMSHINVDREDRLKHGITDGLIRLSVGIEKVEDIMDDIKSALFMNTSS